MRSQTVHADVVVVGGGLAGVCAAVAAARLGASVALVNNRPVLGGNSSSEVRVWVCGATAHGNQRWARESGIIGELYLENQFRNPEGNPVYWDDVVLDAVRREPNLRLFLNTDVREVTASGPDDTRRIDSVTGWTMGSELSTQFVAPLFLDCTGDGLVGHLAGARYRLGKEARSEFDEDWAPARARREFLGSTLLFYTKDLGHPVKYVAPESAIDISTTPIPASRVISAGDSGARYWWVEWGGELDVVDDNERIRDELRGVILGIYPDEVLPQLVRAYRLEALPGDRGSAEAAVSPGAWVTVAEESANRWRQRVHPLTDLGPISALRLVVSQTNGAPEARVVQLRVQR